jgi:hypothetical protein
MTWKITGVGICSSYLAWEWALERVRLELEPDKALRRLTELAQTPLGNAIRADLEHRVLPRLTIQETPAVPLRLKPQSQDALQRLARLAEHSGVPLLEAYPIPWWQQLLLGGLVVACVGCAVWSTARYRYAASVAEPVAIDFILIPEGKFLMGSNDGDKDEQPVHEVRISRPFYLGKYEVTQAQWVAVMGDNPSRFKGDPHARRPRRQSRLPPAEHKAAPEGMVHGPGSRASGHVPVVIPRRLSPDKHFPLAAFGRPQGFEDRGGLYRGGKRGMPEQVQYYVEIARRTGGYDGRIHQGDTAHARPLTDLQLGSNAEVVIKGTTYRLGALVEALIRYQQDDLRTAYGELGQLDRTLSVQPGFRDSGSRRAPASTRYEY